jgi:APA family basic amino acid/polyamine antiporter
MLNIGAIIGAGIFVLLGVAAAAAGPAVILSVIIGGFVAGFTAFSFVKLSSHVAESGSQYIFVKKMISPFAGFITGWVWFFENMIAGGVLSLGLANYVVTLFPNIPLLFVAAFAPILLMIVNVMGIKESSLLNAFLVVLKISVLLLLVILAFIPTSRLHPEFYQPFMPNGWEGVLSGAALIFFAYIGFGRAATAAEEIKNPEKNVPLSIIYALAMSIILYLLTSIVTVGLIGYKKLADSSSPLADTIKYGLNFTWLEILVSIAAIAATASVLLATIIGVSRMMFAMSRDNVLSNSLSKLHPKFGTPYLTIIVAGVVMATLPFLGTLRQIASVTNFGALFIYSMINASAIVLLRKKKSKETIIPISGLGVCLALMLFLDWYAWIIGIIWIIAGVLYYFIKRRNSVDNFNRQKP